ncbi:MAG: recombination protein RecO [Sulfurimonas sp.]|nr:recombination protein RecO [Sulfurimonadaceae bacterium]
MQGFILNVNRVKDEDLIVTILTKNTIETLYRFYGARHGAINIGFKIDFEVEHSAKSSIGRLKDVLHLGYKWINDFNSLKLWQEFVKLFFKHLKDTNEIDEFYFNLLDRSASLWHMQNPKRVALEAYIELLEYEGRLHDELFCFLCSKPIEQKVSLIRAFLPTHKDCSFRFEIDKSSFLELVKNNSTLFLEDSEVDMLWLVLQEGL